MRRAKMRRMLVTLFTVAALLQPISEAAAAVTGFVNSPGSNSTNWTTFVSGTGAGVDTSTSTHILSAR